MGGPGSGRWPGYMSRTPEKETTEEYFALDIRAVKRHGLIEPAAKQEELPGIARIVWRSSGFGAPSEARTHLRPWFLCPQEKCGRRVAILYTFDPKSPQWACRTCHNLCYPVEHARPTGRAILRERKLRWKLGPGGSRPKGMHHTTYERLVRRHIKASAAAEEAGNESLAHLWDQMQKEQIRWDRELPGL